MFLILNMSIILYVGVSVLHGGPLSFWCRLLVQTPRWGGRQWQHVSNILWSQYVVGDQGLWQVEFGDHGITITNHEISNIWLWFNIGLLVTTWIRDHDKFCWTGIKILPIIQELHRRNVFGGYSNQFHIWMLRPMSGPGSLLSRSYRLSEFENFKF